MNWRLGLLLCCWSASVWAGAPLSQQVEICFNYGCLSRWPVALDATRWQGVLLGLERARNEDEERTRLAAAIGRLYALAAEQTPVGRDRGGNLADEGVFGRMDCIDHSTTTTRFLHLIEAQGGLRWHRVVEPVRRGSGPFFQHFSAAIEVLQTHQETPARRYVVDSWFVDNGMPAVILPLEAWMEGEGPDV